VVFINLSDIFGYSLVEFYARGELHAESIGYGGGHDLFPTCRSVGNIGDLLHGQLGVAAFFLDPDQDAERMGVDLFHHFDLCDLLLEVALVYPNRVYPKRTKKLYQLEAVSVRYRDSR
jgi:hypothetical protein